jgi:putative ABC transport system ATP-binding protein
VNAIIEVTNEPAAGSAPPTDSVIELTGVTRSYPGSPPVHAVRDLSLRVLPGELLAVVGPSGSGKSTLLNLMGTLDRPTDGRVAIAGYAVDRLSDRELSALRAEHIGFVFQQFFLTAGVSAVDNVAEGLLYAGLSRRARTAAAVESLRRVGLGHRLRHRPHELSGGERQRVAIARAVVGRPAVVLADEPTGNLDSATSEEIMRVFSDLHEKGQTVIMVTHEPDIAACARRVVVLRDGRVESDRLNQEAAA